MEKWSSRRRTSAGQWRAGAESPAEEGPSNTSACIRSKGTPLWPSFFDSQHFVLSAKTSCGDSANKATNAKFARWRCTNAATIKFWANVPDRGRSPNPLCISASVSRLMYPIVFGCTIS